MVAHVGPFVTRCSHREPSPLWVDRYYPPRRSTIRKSGGCLVVDDHVDSADIIAITLDARGHTWHLPIATLGTTRCAKDWISISPPQPPLSLVERANDAH